MAAAGGGSTHAYCFAGAFEAAVFELVAFEVLAFVLLGFEAGFFWALDFADEAVRLELAVLGFEVFFDVE